MYSLGSYIELKKKQYRAGSKETSDSIVYCKECEDLLTVYLKPC